jgi:hypothetical protein
MTSADITAAINDERRRCAAIIIDYLMAAGADEAQAIGSPLVAKILRPQPDLSGLPAADDAYAAMSWDTSLRGKDTSDA